jgi:hypothetical protein
VDVDKIKLLNVDQNPKTVKGQKRGYLTGVLYLAPAKLSGFEVCPGRSKGCTAACLNTAGHGAFNNVQKARIRKTKWFFKDREGFMMQLVDEVFALIRKAKRLNMIPVVRLNGTSDIDWTRIKVDGYPNIMEMFPNIQFYDYTKVEKRAIAWAYNEMPPNYHLTFSLSEENERKAERVLEANGNVAVVFRSMPSTYMGRQVVDGDADDLRFANMMPQGYVSTKRIGVIVGLKPKGRARRDASGFVR